MRALIAGALLAAGALLGAPAAQALPAQRVLCDFLDADIPPAGLFDLYAKQARRENMSANEFDVAMWNNLTLCPQYKQDYARWHAGL